MFEVRNEFLKLDGVEAATGFPLHILGLFGVIKPIKEDGREIQDMTNFANGVVLDKALYIVLQEQVVVHSNMTQATAPIRNVAIEMTEQAIKGMCQQDTQINGTW